MGKLAPILIAIAFSYASPALAQPSAFGSGFDLRDFYKPFTLDEITPENQQKWPYYKHVSAHWDDYALHGTAKIKRAVNPAKLEQGERLDLNAEFENGKSFIESLQATQTKGFVVMKDNTILSEF